MAAQSLRVRFPPLPRKIAVAKKAHAEYSQRIIYLFDGQVVSENIQKKFKL